MAGLRYRNILAHQVCLTLAGDVRETKGSGWLSGLSGSGHLSPRILAGVYPRPIHASQCWCPSLTFLELIRRGPR